MCLITSPKDKEEYVKETYIAPRPAATTSQVYAYRDGTFGREYTTTPAVVRPEYARSDYAPSVRSHRSRRSTSSRRSSYVTGVPVSTSPTRVRHVYPVEAQTTQMVPVTRTETVYVTDGMSPRSSRVNNVYTTGRVSPALVMEDKRRRNSQVYY